MFILWNHGRFAPSTESSHKLTKILKIQFSLISQFVISELAPDYFHSRRDFQRHPGVQWRSVGIVDRTRVAILNECWLYAVYVCRCLRAVRSGTLLNHERKVERWKNAKQRRKKVRLSIEINCWLCRRRKRLIDFRKDCLVLPGPLERSGIGWA